MGDPTGLSGIVVGKLVDKLIKETRTAINCQKNCLALSKRLENIRGLVDWDSVPQNLPTNRHGMAVAEWLDDVSKFLEETRALVLKCNEKEKWNYWRRWKCSRKILNATQKIDDICNVEAPLASINIILRIAEQLGEVPRDVANVVKESFQPDMKNINDKLDTLTEAKKIFSDQTSSSGRTCQKAELRPTRGRTFGVDGPLKTLQDLLLGDLSKDTKCVGVCGTGGIGKTRLAELVYNSKDVQDHFQIPIWLTVGNDGSVKTLLPQLAKKLDVKVDGLKEDEIKAKLFNEVADKKGLLVLDDIWDKVQGKGRGHILDFMLDITSGWGTGSKILVTTRDFTVLRNKLGKEVANLSTVMMKTLFFNDSWELFREVAFKGVDKITPAVEKLAKDAAKECKGLPLALNVVAGALAGKESTSEWRRALVKLKEAEVLHGCGHEEALYGKLQLSYDDLEDKNDPDPYRLQKFFIYFAGFREDSDVDATKMVSLWAGEKLLHGYDSDSDDIDPLEEGNCFLRELIERSLIELRKEEPLTCRVHDVLRDFARHLIREKRAPPGMNCLFSPGRQHEKFPEKWLKTLLPGGLISDATHLSLNDNSLQSLPDRLYAPTLEVLLMANNAVSYGSKLVIPPGFMESFSSLKVLDLQNTVGDSFPETLGTLTNLTFLELSGSWLKKLPTGLRNLTKLEYLGLSDCKDLEPFSVECLKNLSTLNTSNCPKVWQQPTNELELDPLSSLSLLTNLRNLYIEGDRQYLPAAFAELVNLRHLEVSFSNLATLPPELHCSNEPKLSKLRYLSLRNCRSLSELPSWVGSLSHLETLDLGYCEGLTSLPNLSKLVELRHLNLECCRSLTQLPLHFASKEAFPLLKRLNLNYCRELEEFPPIKEGAFPKLERLDMGRCEAFKQLGKGFASKGAFPALESLNLNNCRVLEEFPPREEGAFSKLEWLDMESCIALKQLGKGFGSKGAFPSLERLNLSNCCVLEEFPPREEGAFSKLERLDMKSCIALKQLGKGFGSKRAFPALERLNLNYCRELEEFPPIEEGAFPKLERLDMGGCEAFKQLGKGFASKGAFPTLESLNLNNCRVLEEFPPREEGVFSKLERLDLGGCKALRQLGKGFGSKGAFPALERLNLSNCCVLEEFPPTEESAFSKLERLDMKSCIALKQLGKGFGSKGAFPALESLNLFNCGVFEEFPPREEGAFLKLERLDMQSCIALKQLGKGFGSKGAFPALERLNLNYCGELEEFPPIEEGAFLKLEELDMKSCIALKQLGKGFGSKGAFPALERLNLSNCCVLEEFPPREEGAFSKLEWLDLRGCKALKQLGKGFGSKGAFPALTRLNLD